MTDLPAPDIVQKFHSGTIQVRAALDSVQESMSCKHVQDSAAVTSQIVLGEVLNNVVEHAYLFEEGRPITLSVWFVEAGVHCEIVDEGQPMPNGVPPIGTAHIIKTSDRNDLPEGGFGWAMVRELTEDLKYHRFENKNCLSFLIPSQQP